MPLIRLVPQGSCECLVSSGAPASSISEKTLFSQERLRTKELYWVYSWINCIDPIYSEERSGTNKFEQFWGECGSQHNCVIPTKLVPYWVRTLCSGVAESFMDYWASVIWWVERRCISCCVLCTKCRHLRWITPWFSSMVLHSENLIINFPLNFIYY